MNDLLPLLSSASLIGNTQRRFAATLSLLLFVFGIALTPFANSPWLPVPGYMTAFGAAMLVTNFMLAVLLFSRGMTSPFKVSKSPTVSVNRLKFGSLSIKAV